MSLSRCVRRASGTTALLVSLALGAGAVAPVVLGGLEPAMAAAAQDCAAPFPVSDLVVGDDLAGLTVTTGTTPQSFSAKVLGVLTDGIAPGVDMIMVKVDPTGLDIDPAEVKGIWQGMSGSPLYASDGRLVGAVSYGLASYQQSWVAGVTPFADMKEYVTAPPAHTVRLNARAARTVARAAGVSSAGASNGFTQLPMPLGVSGAPSRFLQPTAKEKARHTWLSSGGTIGRAAASSGLGADTIVAGGNVAAAMTYGDVTMAGVGTATSVCADQVVAFGHPFGFFGETTLTLHPAESLYIQGDAPSFKVANIGAPVGTVFGDHLTAITGAFGELPDATAVTTKASYGTRQRTGTSHVSVQDPDSLAMSSYLQSASNDTRVVDAMIPGSKLMTWKLAGTDARGAGFALSWTDRYFAGYDVSDEAGMALGDVVYKVASMPGVTLDSVTTAGQISKNATIFSVARLEARRSGAWSRVSYRRPLVARPGHSFTVRAVLRSTSGGVLTVPFTFAVPRRASGKMAMLAITGGASVRLNLGTSIASARKALGTAVRSDVLRAQFGRSVSGVDDYDDYDDEDYRVAAHSRRSGPRIVKFTHTKKSAPHTAVIAGSAAAMVLVR